VNIVANVFRKGGFLQFVEGGCVRYAMFPVGAFDFGVAAGNFVSHTTAAGSGTARRSRW